jgi:hypothetical protein
MYDNICSKINAIHICMYMCVYIEVYVYRYIYIYIHIPLYTHTNTYMYISIKSILKYKCIFLYLNNNCIQWHYVYHILYILTLISFSIFSTIHPIYMYISISLILHVYINIG